MAPRSRSASDERARRTRSSGNSSPAGQPEPKGTKSGSVAWPSTASARSFTSTVSARRGGFDVPGSSTAGGVRFT